MGYPTEVTALRARIAELENRVDDLLEANTTVIWNERARPKRSWRNMSIVFASGRRQQRNPTNIKHQSTYPTPSGRM
jgi:hypothetical protein